MKLAKLDYYPWFYVEHETAKDFMAYLAAVFSQHNDLSATPVTENEAELKRILTAGIQVSKFELQLSSFRTEILDSILPVPSKAIPARKILRFKDRYGRELRKFRRRIEREVIQLAQITEEPYRNRQRDLFLQEAREEMIQIKDAMDRKGWKARLDRFVSLIAPLHPILGVAREITNVSRHNNTTKANSDFIYAAHIGHRLK
jgi:hypothetical protein